MEIRQRFGQDFEAVLILEAAAHTLQFNVTNLTTGRTICIYTRDAVENITGNQEQCHCLPGRFELFNQRSDLYLSRENDEYADIHLTTPAQADTGVSLPGLIANYCFRLYKVQPVITVTTSFTGEYNAYAVNLNWMNLYIERQDFIEFFGAGPDMEGRIDQLERPVSFTKGLVLMGTNGSIGVTGGGYPLYNPVTGQLIPDSLLGGLNRDLRYNGKTRPLTASLVFGTQGEDANRLLSMADNLDKDGLVMQHTQRPDILESHTLSSGPLSITVARLPGGVILLDNIKKDCGPSLKSSQLVEIHAKRLSDGEELIFEGQRCWEKAAVYHQSNGLHIELRNPYQGRIRDFAVVIDVHVTRHGRMEWSTSVLNDNPDISVLIASYPTMCFSGKNIEAFVPVDSGQVECDAAGHDIHISGHYPRGFAFVMPYFAFYDTTSAVDNGLYIGVHDPDGARKDFIVDTCGAAGDGMIISRFPATASGRPANAFSLPGTMVWEVFSGDWFDAAKIYKEFVLNNASWIPAVGPEGREDTPKWMREMPFWIMDWMANDNPDASPLPISIRPKEPVHDRDVWYKLPMKLQAALGTPMGYHIYNWHWIPFNNDFPHYFPVKPGFEQGVSVMQANGIYAMPYINGRLWDTLDKRDEDYRFSKEALPWTAKDANGRPYVESYASYEPNGELCKLAVMCPSSALWKTELSHIVERLFYDMGLKAIYIDQVAAANVNLCMDEKHNHLPGGGDWWVKEYNLLMQRLNMVKPRDCGYSTECNSEVYAKSFDAYLTWVWIHPNQVPAFSSIYAGYVIMLGRNINGHKKEDIPYFKHHIAEQVIYGQQIGWINPDVLSNCEKFAFLKKMVQLRYRYTPFFYKGTMLRPPKVSSRLGEIVTFAGMSYTRAFNIPAVLSGAWRLWDDTGSVIFITNISEEADECEITINMKEYGIKEPGSLKIADGDGAIKAYSVLGDTLTLTCHIASCDFLAIEW